MSYLFKREDTGEIVELPFSYVMDKDVMGYVELPDGVRAKHCVRLEIERDGGAKRPEKAPPPATDRPIVSDALGFTRDQLADFEADRQAHGFSGVEFKPDPDVPQFYQVHVSSQKEWKRYIKHRGMIDRNSRNGGGRPLSADQMSQAEQRAREMYPGKGIVPASESPVDNARES